MADLDLRPIRRMLAPSDDVLWFRQSTEGSWLLCPGRVMQSEHEGFNNLPSEAMSFGTLVHAMVEATLSDPSVNFTTIEAADLWHDLVRDEYGVELEHLADRDLIDASAQEAVGAWHLWKTQVAPTLPSGEQLIEKTLRAPLGVLDSGRDVWLHGTGDLLYLDGHVGYDWKTAGNLRKWDSGHVDMMGQPSAYGYLHLFNHGVFISRWKYWVYSRKDAQWVLYETTRTEQQSAAWLRSAFGIAKAIDAGATSYTPVGEQYGKVKRGWWCSPKYCGAWNICPGKYLNDDVDESQEGVVAWT